MRYLLQFPVWGDEAFICLNMVDQSYLGLTGQLRCSQVAPVLFLWGELTAFLTLGHSELALRLLPLLAGLGGLLLTWRLAHLILSPLGRALAVAFLAVAIWPVSMSTVIKPYSLDLLMSAALLVPAVEWLRRPERVRWLLVLAVVMPVAVFGSYPSVFVAGGVSLALLAQVWRQPGWQAKTAYALANVLLFGSFAGSYFLVGLNQLDRTTGLTNTFLQDYWKHGFPPSGALPFLKWLVLINTGRLFAYPLGGSDGLSVVTTLLCLAGLVVLWRRQRRDLFVLCLTPFALGLVAAFLHRYPYGGCCRISQHMAPIICLLAGGGAAALFDRIRAAEPRRRWIGIVCCLFAAIGMGGALTDVIWPYRGQTDLWAHKLVHSVLARCGPDDQVVVLNPENGVDVVFHWELMRHRLRGGYLGWNGQLDAERLQRKTGQVWVLDLALWNAGETPRLSSEEMVLKKLQAELRRSQQSWQLVNQIPYTVIPTKKRDPRMRCEVYRWMSPSAAVARAAALELPCWP